MAQDVIVKKDGTTILAKVTKVGDKEIEYKKYKSGSDRLYSISTSNVMAINYEDGEKDTFNNANVSNSSAVTTTSKGGPVFVNLPPAANNQELIKAHCPQVLFAKHARNKDAHYFFPIMGMSESSIISNDEIEMDIVANVFEWEVKYKINLENKTNGIIYVDLANSFRYYTDGTSKSYYDNEQTTVTDGNGNGVTANLGVIAGVLGANGPVGALASAFTVGGGSQHSVSSTYSKERILAIPPHSTKALVEYKEVQTKKASLIRNPEFKTISDLDSYGFSLDALRGELKTGDHIAYTEESSPYYAQHLITYSCASDFSTYSQLYAKLYARYVVAGDYRPWAQGSDVMIKSIKKYIPNYWDVPGIMVGDVSYIGKK